MSKIYKSKVQFQQETLGWLAKILEAPGLRIHVHNIIGGGDCEWMTAEMRAKAMCKNGERLEDVVYEFGALLTITQCKANHIT